MTAWAPSTYPADSDVLGNYPLWDRRMQQALEDVNNREHAAVAGNYGATDGSYTGGEHKNGSAVCYIGTTAPTHAPDSGDPYSVTALSTGNVDKGRLWLDTNTTPPVLKGWNGTGWVTLDVAGAARIFVGDYTTTTAFDNPPTKKPDGVANLDAADNGRLAYDTDTVLGSALYRYLHGTGWVELGLVSLLRDQTIKGVKNFESSPIVPAPTTDLQASTKKYVDDAVTPGVWAEVSKNDLKGVDATLAATRGTFIGIISQDYEADKGARIFGYTDAIGANPPTTVRGQASVWSSRNGPMSYNLNSSFAIPVIKGAYYKATYTKQAAAASESITYYWLPEGA